MAEDLATHLQRSVDLQIVESAPASEARSCQTSNPKADAVAGRMLCEVLYGTSVSQPTFGHSLGNTWLTAPASQNGTFAGCDFSNASDWRACVGANVAKQAAMLTAEAPHILLSAGLMEFLHRNNVDDPQSWEACCVPGTIGQWDGGGNQTCVPDVMSECVQAYYVEWGKVYMDAGIRAFFFGQARLTGGGRGCDADGTGCSRVSTKGASGFARVIEALRAYAAEQGYGSVYFGPQAASGFQLANGTQVADWSYGAQHLAARAQWLVQPFGVNGTSPALGPQWYGAGDLHDANRVNNANGLPVLLDFDNFSGDEAVPDDIRRLASWPNRTRSAFVRTLWHTLRLYNPRATLSIPLSKAAGGNWPAFSQPQPQCWSGAWGGAGADGLYFGAVSCGLVNVTKDIFSGSPEPGPQDILHAVDLGHFGGALQSPDLTAVWAHRVLLARDFANVSEYSSAVQRLPPLVLGARGSRCAYAKALIASAEFRASACASQSGCAEARLRTLLCLDMPQCTADANLIAGRLVSSEHTNMLDGIADALCRAADGLSLFGNAALMDPGWCIGCS